MPTKLGQNFLNNPEITEKIITTSNLDKDDAVLEIGPGEGVLTKALAEKTGKVIAIEIDDKLIPSLKEKFQNQENVHIVHNDILKINLPELCKNYNLEPITYKLIANIPYYITSKIIRLFLETPHPPQEIMLMVQKEVAERIVASPGKMSKLSVSVQYFAEVEYLFTVGKENFTPEPEVDSAFIRIFNIKEKTKQESKQFFKTVRAGFCARRKTLTNNLSNSLHKDKKTVKKTLEKLNIRPTTRAQELSIDDWQKLSELI
jgi:16S rRNA (adenine1518-N6/adenine1519-N6)-dimethyltransferase